MAVVIHNTLRSALPSFHLLKNTVSNCLKESFEPWDETIQTIQLFNHPPCALGDKQEKRDWYKKSGRLLEKPGKADWNAGTKEAGCTLGITTIRGWEEQQRKTGHEAGYDHHYRHRYFNDGAALLGQ